MLTGVLELAQKHIENSLRQDIAEKHGGNLDT